jgi:hypothetical protein
MAWNWLAAVHVESDPASLVFTFPAVGIAVAVVAITIAAVRGHPDHPDDDR